MQITTGIGIYWSSLKHAQIGIDNRIAQGFSDLEKNELRFIESLTLPYSAEEITLLTAQYKIHPSRAEKIIRLLATLNLLEPPELETQDPYLHSEYRAHWRIYGEIPANRKQVKIILPHLDLLSTEIALSLAASGITRFILHDSTPVGTFSHPVLQKQIIGIAKNRALANYFRANFPHVKCETGKPHPADRSMHADFHRPKHPAINKNTAQIAIISTNNAPDPLEIDACLSRGIPALILITGEIDLTVGPFCFPGIGPCGMCLERYQNDTDPNWAVLAPQARAIRNLPLPVANVKLAAGLALRAILEFTDSSETYTSVMAQSKQSTESQTAEQNRNPKHRCVYSAQVLHSLQLFSRAWIISPNPALPCLKQLEAHPDCLCKINFTSRNSQGTPEKKKTQICIAPENLNPTQTTHQNMQK